jgi:cytosine deaminase
MLIIGNMLAHVVQFGTQEDQMTILEMGTTNAARAIGLKDAYGLAVGKQADLVILDTYQIADVLLDMPSRCWVAKRGKITVVTQHACEILRDQAR